MGCSNRLTTYSVDEAAQRFSLFGVTVGFPLGKFMFKFDEDKISFMDDPAGLLVQCASLAMSTGFQNETVVETDPSRNVQP